ncbi:MAG TPA: CPBP family intramembrane glutamic endopeptidase [Longimicrobiales bacterium]
MHPETKRTAWRLLLLPPLCVMIAGLYPLLVEGVLLLRAGHSPPEALLRAFTAADAGSAPALVAILIIAPLLEEVIFRGIVLRSLDALLPPALAVLLSAALFAAAYWDADQLLPAFAAGVVFGWVYLATGSLFLPILGHIFWNAQMLLFGWWPWLELPPAELAHADGGLPLQPAWWLAVCAAAAVGGAVALGIGIRRADRAVILA